MGLLISTSSNNEISRGEVDGSMTSVADKQRGSTRLVEIDLRNPFKLYEVLGVGHEAVGAHVTFPLGIFGLRSNVAKWLFPSLFEAIISIIILCLSTGVIQSLRSQGSEHNG
jgi:hypothetical protein